ncbi:MAG: 1,2-phenylacetyl-CoA epoxidase subunit PaaC [Acidimicrobiales bacterium]
MSVDQGLIDGPIREFILALADDEHLMGQQHTEWIGVAPFLEEDLAFSSIAQDELGHAAMLYELLDGENGIDALAFGRDVGDYRSCWLVEYATTDWAEALVRHWLYDIAEELRWNLLLTSSIEGLSEIAQRALAEERFHRMHADGLLDALLEVDDARSRIRAALDSMLPLALTMFETLASEKAAAAAGAALSTLAEQQQVWQAAVDQRFDDVEWSAISATPESTRAARSDDFAPLMSRMREVIDLDPLAIW